MQSAMTPGTVNSGALKYARPATSAPQASGPMQQAAATNQWQNRGGSPAMSMQAPSGASGVSGGYGSPSMSMQAPGMYSPAAISGGGTTAGRLPGGVASGYSYPGTNMNAGSSAAGSAGSYRPSGVGGVDPGYDLGGGRTGGSIGGTVGATPGGGMDRPLPIQSGKAGQTPGSGFRMLTPTGGYNGSNFEGSFQNPGGLMSPGTGGGQTGGGTTYPGTGSGSGSGGGYSGVDPGYNMGGNNGGLYGGGAQAGSGGGLDRPYGGTAAGYQAYGSGQLNQTTQNPNQVPAARTSTGAVSQVAQRPQTSQQPNQTQQPQPQPQPQQLDKPLGVAAQPAQQPTGSSIYTAANPPQRQYWPKGQGFSDLIPETRNGVTKDKYDWMVEDNNRSDQRAWDNSDVATRTRMWGTPQEADAVVKGQNARDGFYQILSGNQQIGGDSTAATAANWQKKQAAKQQGQSTGNARQQFTQKPQTPAANPYTRGAETGAAAKPQTPAVNPYTRGAEGKGNVGFASNPEGESGGMSTQGPQDMAAAQQVPQQQQYVPQPSSDDYQVAAGIGTNTPEQIQRAKDRISAWESQNQGQQNPNQGIFQQQVQQGQTGYVPWQQGGNFYGLDVGAADVDWKTKIASPTGASGEYVQPAPQGNFPGQPYPGAAGTIVNQDGSGSAWNYGSPQNTDTMNYQAYLSWLQSQGIAGGSGNSGGSSGGSSGGRSGGSGSSSPQTGLLIPDLYQKAYEEARKANEDRYNQILAGYGANYQDAMDWQGRSANNLINQYDERYNRNMDTVAGLGAQELKDIQDRFTAERGSAEAGLMDRGLGNTTIRPSVLGGITRNESDALGGALDRINRLKLQTDMALSGDALANQQGLHGERLGLMTELPQRQLDFMERRTDSYPDLNQLLALGQMYGQAQGQNANSGGMLPPSYNGTGNYQVPNPGMIGSGYPYPNSGGGGGGGGNTGGSGGGNGGSWGAPGTNSSSPYPGATQQGPPMTSYPGYAPPGYRYNPTTGQYEPDPSSDETPMDPNDPWSGGGSMPGTTEPGLPAPGVTGPVYTGGPGSLWGGNYANQPIMVPNNPNPTNRPIMVPDATASMTMHAPQDGNSMAAGATGYPPGTLPNGGMPNRLYNNPANPFDPNYGSGSGVHVPPTPAPVSGNPFDPSYPQPAPQPQPQPQPSWPTLPGASNNPFDPGYGGTPAPVNSTNNPFNPGYGTPSTYVPPEGGSIYNPNRFSTPAAYYGTLPEGSAQKARFDGEISQRYGVPWGALRPEQQREELQRRGIIIG